MSVIKGASNPDGKPCPVPEAFKRRLNGDRSEVAPMLSLTHYLMKRAHAQLGPSADHIELSRFAEEAHGLRFEKVASQQRDGKGA